MTRCVFESTRRAVAIFTLACLQTIAVAPASAQTTPAPSWPDKNTRLIVPFPAGGVLDALTRSVAEQLQAASGRAVTVENVPGAAGNLGIQQVARAPGDGATVLFIPQGNITINATLMPSTPFQWARDFKPVTLAAYAPNVLVVHPSVPAKTVKELIDHARANPAKLAYASPGNGSSLHLIGELLKREARIDMLHVPYKGTPPAMQDLIGGQVQVMFGAVPTLLPAIKAGQVRALAVTTSRRAAVLPDLPTLAEGGVANIDVPSWYGVMVPTSTPDELVTRMHAAITDALRKSRERLAAQGLEAVANTPADFAAQIQRETAVWAGVIREANIKAE